MTALEVQEKLEAFFGNESYWRGALHCAVLLTVIWVSVWVANA